MQYRFLLAKFHFESLKSKSTIQKVKTALQSLPSGSNVKESTNKTYEELMQRIEQQEDDSRALARHALTWVVFVHSPVTISGLLHAVAIMDNPELVVVPTPDYLVDSSHMISVCAGLLEIERETDTIRLVHYTAKEYFDATTDIWFSETSPRLISICSAYVLYLERYRNDQEEKEKHRIRWDCQIMDVMLLDLPLATYALNYCMRPVMTTLTTCNPGSDELMLCQLKLQSLLQLQSFCIGECLGPSFQIGLRHS